MSQQSSLALVSERKILEELAQKGPQTWSELLKATGLSTRTLRKALLRLEKRGEVYRKILEGEKYPPPVLYGLTPKGKEKVIPLLFALMAKDYVLGIKQDFSAINVREKKGGVEFRIPLKDLYEGMSPEERLHAMARRQLAVQLFALLKAVETGDTSWLIHIPLELIGDFWLPIQLGLPFKQIWTEKFLKLQKILEERGGDIIMLMEGDSISIQVREDFAEKLRELLERAFPEEIKQIKQIYEEATKFKEKP